MEIPIMTIVARLARAVFHEINKYYPQIFLENVCINYK